VHRRSRFLTSADPKTGFSSQEPRRPRFSFFHLHNVKEQTPWPGWARRRWKRRFLILRTEVCFRLPGSLSALSEIVSSGGDWHPASLTLAGYKTGTFPCQHPILNFRISSFFQNLKVQIALYFQRLAEVSWVVSGPALISDGGLYGGVIWVSTAQNDKSDIFAASILAALGTPWFASILAPAFPRSSTGHPRSSPHDS
jgi:hypothetical protein